MSKVCEYQGYYIDYDEETGEEDVLKCQLFTDEGEWNEYCYCDEEERNNCMLYKYSKYIEEKGKEIERLNNIIDECAEDILKELEKRAIKENKEYDKDKLEKYYKLNQKLKELEKEYNDYKKTLYEKVD